MAQASGVHCPRNGLWTRSYAANRHTTPGLHRFRCARDERSTSWSPTSDSDTAPLHYNGTGLLRPSIPNLLAGRWRLRLLREIFTQQTQAPANRNARSKQWQPWLAARQLKRLRLNGNRALPRTMTASDYNHLAQYTLGWLSAMGLRKTQDQDLS